MLVGEGVVEAYVGVQLFHSMGNKYSEFGSCVKVCMYYISGFTGTEYFDQCICKNNDVEPDKYSKGPEQLIFRAKK